MLAGACGSDSGDGAPPTHAEAEATLRRIVLQAADAGAGFVQDAARVQTNEDAAKARPDTESARRQYADWGQVLMLNVQYGAPPSAELVFTGMTARVMNTATLFRTAEGAGSALAYLRALPEQTVEDFLVNEGAGTKIAGTQVTRDLDVPAKGDESFAWRASGKATFADGFTVSFVADTVFVRVGRVNGAVTAVALGGAPDRAELLALVDRFVERARAEDA